MTTGEVIKLLQKLDPEGNMEFCVVGHYGEANNFHPADFYVRDAHKNFADSWRKAIQTPQVKVVAVHAPDIGEEPD